jgi:hypothetical protein
MFAFILTNIFFLSLTGVILLVVRALPRVEEDKVKKQSFLDKIAASEIPEKLDAALGSTMFKLLRKLKVLILRLDNYINKEIKRFSRGVAEKPSQDFKGMVEEEKDETDLLSK